MKRTTKHVLMGYGAFCAVNWAVTYYAARSGSPLLFGSAALLNFNESLRPLNLLSRVLDPIALATRYASGPPPALTNQDLGLTDQALASPTWN